MVTAALTVGIAGNKLPTPVIITAVITVTKILNVFLTILFVFLLNINLKFIDIFISTAIDIYTINILLFIDCTPSGHKLFFIDYYKIKTYDFIQAQASQF